MYFSYLPIARIGSFEYLASHIRGERRSHAKQHQPDVILLDISMPQLNGLAATPVIKQVAPNAKVLIVTEHESPAFVRQALVAGATGFLPKTDLGKELVMAVREVNKGGSFLSDRMRAAVQKFVPIDPAPSVAPDGQSGRTNPSKG